MRKAFTIIEVLVVIIIIGIMLGIGSLSYRDFARRQSVVSAKRQVLSDVRAAQSDAGSGRKPAVCTGTLQGYRFRVTGSSPASYEISIVCDSESVLKQASLPADIEFAVSGPNSVLFLPIAQGTDLPGDMIVTIRNTGTANTETLLIKPSGEIQ